MSRIWVKVANPKIRVPIEGARRAYYDPEKAHFVPDTPFVRRRLAERDLVEADPQEAAAPAVPDAVKTVAGATKSTPAAEPVTAQEH